MSAQYPEALASFVQYRVTADPHTIGENPVAVFAATSVGKGVDHLRAVTHLPREKWLEHGDRLLVFTHHTSPTEGWTAGFSYVDILRPQVLEAFLQSTHQQYYRRFGTDFGGAIPAIFTDEPNLQNHGPQTLPFSFWLVQEFRKRNGYDLIQHLPCLFEDVTGEPMEHPAEKVRFDYYDTLHHLLVNNWVEPTARWCADHGINWTGHYFEHLWPHVNCLSTPAVQSLYEYHQWPAIDMLLSKYLKDRPSHVIVHTVRELKSAVNQMGKERAVCELYGAGGWDSSFDDYKRMADWVMVNGVNFVCQHLTYSTICGARKHDHPQSFDWRQPWWDQYTHLNDYVGRTCWLLSQGRMEQRILVLNPTTTGYLTASGAERGAIEHSGGTDAVTNPDMTTFLSLCQKLTDWQWDFDLGDEYTLARHGNAANGTLRVGMQRYACVILTDSIKNLLSSTADLLKACVQNGIPVLAVGQPGEAIDGKIDRLTYASMRENWTMLSLRDMDNALSRLLPRRITADAPFPEGFAHMRRALDDGRTLWFFTNQAMAPYDATVTLEGQSVCQLNLFTGEVEEIPYTVSAGCVQVPLSLVRNQSRMLLVSPLPGKASLAEKQPDTEIPLALCRIEREQDNVLPLLYADYGNRKGIYVKHLCKQIYRERGFSANPWDKQVQFRRNVLNRDKEYDESSGFTAIYRFTVGDGFVPAALKAVAEHPEFCRLKVNSVPVPWIPGEWWMDHHFGVADITALVHPGENEIAVVVDRFRVWMELDALYLKGDFSVDAKDGVWILCPPRSLTNGSWLCQGLPFYPFAVTYRYTARLDNVPKAARAGSGWLPRHRPIVDRERQDAGLLHADGQRAASIQGLLQAGDNEIVLRVCGSHKNFLGPHFVKERGSAWPDMWWESPLHQPPAEQYDLLAFGLTEPPRLTVAY